MERKRKESTDKKSLTRKKFLKFSLVLASVLVLGVLALLRGGSPSTDEPFGSILTSTPSPSLTPTKEPFTPTSTSTPTSTPTPTPEETAEVIDISPDISLSALVSGLTIPKPGDHGILEALNTLPSDIDLSQVVIKDENGNPLPYFKFPKIEVVNGKPVIKVEENHYGAVVQDSEGQSYILPLPKEVTFVEGEAIEQATSELVQDEEGNWEIVYKDNQGEEIAQFKLESLVASGWRISVPVIKPSTANAIDYDLPQKGIGEAINVGLKLVPWVVSKGAKGETTIFFSPEEGKMLAFNLPEKVKSNGLKIERSGDEWIIYSQGEKVGEIVGLVSDQPTDKVYKVLWDESLFTPRFTVNSSRVYSGPGLFYSSRPDALSPDTQVNIIGSTDSGAWVKIEWRNEDGEVVTGWVMTSELRFDFNEVDQNFFDNLPIIHKYPPIPTPEVNNQEITEGFVNIEELNQQFQWLVVYNEETGEYERILGNKVVSVQKKGGQIIAVKNENGEWVEALLLSRRGGSLGFEGMVTKVFDNGSAKVAFTGFSTGKFSSFPDYTYSVKYSNEKGEEVSKQLTVRAMQILIPVEYSRVVQGNKVVYEPTVFYPLWITIDFVDEKGNSFPQKIGTHWLGENYFGVWGTSDLIYYFQSHPGIEVRIEQLDVLPPSETFLEQFSNHPDVDVRIGIKAYESYFSDQRIQENNRLMYNCAKKAYSWKKSHLGATPEEFRRIIENGFCTLPSSTSPVGFLGSVGGMPNPNK